MVAYRTLVVGLSVTFGKVFGSYQTEITQAVIGAIGVRSRYRRLVTMLIRDRDCFAVHGRGRGVDRRAVANRARRRASRHDGVV